MTAARFLLLIVSQQASAGPIMSALPRRCQRRPACYNFVNPAPVSRAFFLNETMQQVQRLSKAFGAQVLFENVTWNVSEGDRGRSEEHTSELQSQSNLVCRLF